VPHRHPFFESLAQAWDRRLRTPFACLLRHSLARIFAGGEGAEPGELDLGIGTVFALLAVPGVFVSIFLSDRYGTLFLFLRGQRIRFDPFTVSVPDEYFFIVLAFVVAAAVAVWKWDRLLPDRRDFANFAPLPIASSTFFFANLFAILLLAVLLSLDVNAASCFLFSLFVTAQESAGVFLKFLGTHALTVFLASTFGFLAVFAILGAMMAFLPFHAFRKLSPWVRCSLILFLVAVLSTSFSVPQKLLTLNAAAHPWTGVPPPAWFLGFCQSLRGRGDRLLLSLSSAALWALCWVFVVFLAAYFFGYRRSYLRSAELTATLSASGSRFSACFRLLDKCLLTNSLERASYRFALRTIFRSEEHTFALGAFASLGVVLASQTVLSAVATQSSAHSPIPSAPLLSVPLILGYFLILGLCLAFSIPAPLRANWVFRFNVDPATRNCARLARKVILTFAFPLLFVPCLLIYSHFWGWRVGGLHAAVVVVWCILLMEGVLIRFRKIPFTCSVPKFKSHAIATALLFLLGYFAFTSLTAGIEAWALADSGVLCLVFLPIVIIAAMVIAVQRRGLIESDRRLIFDEQPVTTVEAMNLAR
jgi:hypothetical protein